MSDVGRLKRHGGTLFPSVRKSADPFTPEAGEADFSQDLVEFDALASIAVREPEKTEEAVIRDENRRKQFKYRKRKRKQEDDEEPVEETEILVDLQA